MSTIVRPRRRCPSGLGQLSTRKKSGVQLQGKPAAEPTSVASTLSESSPGRSISVWPRAASSRVGAKAGGSGEAALRKHGREGFLQRSRSLGVRRATCVRGAPLCEYSLHTSRTRSTREGDVWTGLHITHARNGRLNYAHDSAQPCDLRAEAPAGDVPMTATRTCHTITKQQRH